MSKRRGARARRPHCDRGPRPDARTGRNVRAPQDHDEAAPHPDRHGLGAAARAELGQDRRHVELRRVSGDAELSGDDRSRGLRPACRSTSISRAGGGAPTGSPPARVRAGGAPRPPTQRLRVQRHEAGRRPPRRPRGSRPMSRRGGEHPAGGRDRARASARRAPAPGSSASTMRAAPAPIVHAGQHGTRSAHLSRSSTTTSG